MAPVKSRDVWPLWEGSGIRYQVTIREEPPRRLFGVRHRGPYAQISRGFETVISRFVACNGWDNIRDVVAVYQSDPRVVSVVALRSIAAVSVGPDAVRPEELEEFTLRGGRTAVLRVRGPYAGLPAAYDWLFGLWLPASGLRAAKVPPFDIYINSPTVTAPENLLTDICVTLQ